MALSCCCVDQQVSWGLPDSHRNQKGRRLTNRLHPPPKMRRYDLESSRPSPKVKADRGQSQIPTEEVLPVEPRPGEGTLMVESRGRIRCVRLPGCGTAWREV